MLLWGRRGWGVHVTWGATPRDARGPSGPVLAATLALATALTLVRRLRTVRGDVAILATIPAGTDEFLFLGSGLLLLIVVVVLALLLGVVLVLLLLLMLRRSLLNLLLMRVAPASNLCDD